MAIDCTDIDRAAGAAAWAIDIQPRHSGEDGSPNGRRPHAALARRERCIPLLNDARSFLARRLLRCARPHVESHPVRARWVVLRHRQQYRPPAATAPAISTRM